jgi:hypothetical protein
VTAEDTIDGILLFLFLVVGGWVVAFGMSNAILARQRGRSGSFGFVLGAALGPVAWGWTLWATRPGRVPLTTRVDRARTAATPVARAGADRARAGAEKVRARRSGPR